MELLDNLSSAVERSAVDAPVSLVIGITIPSSPKLSKFHDAIPSRLPPAIYPPVIMRKFEPRQKHYRPATQSKLAISTSIDDDMESKEAASSHASKLVGVVDIKFPVLGQDSEEVELNVDCEVESVPHRPSQAVDNLGKILAVELEKGFADVFDIYESMPLTHKKKRYLLTMPVNAAEWCIAVIMQRWFQSIGYKWQATATELMNYAKQGLIHLQKMHEGGLPSCALQPTKLIAHQWAFEIIDEIEREILYPRKGAATRFGDRSWSFPWVIVPSVIEYLPLSYDERKDFYAKVVDKWKYLEAPRDHRLWYSKIGETRKTVKNDFLLKVEKELGDVCLDIGLKMKTFFHAANGPLKLKQMMRDYEEEMEVENKRVEDLAAAMGKAHKRIQEKERELARRCKLPTEGLSADPLKDEISRRVGGQRDLPDTPLWNWSDSDASDSSSSEEEWWEGL